MEYTITKDGRVLNKFGKELKPGMSKKGYKYVILSNGKHQKGIAVHRLVAQTYLPNPNNLQQVHHKDGDKTNNNVENLEWIDYKEHLTVHKSKPVYCVELNRVFNSLLEAAEYTNTFDMSIGRCCRGKRKTAGGYHWEYAMGSMKSTDNDTINSVRNISSVCNNR